MAPIKASRRKSTSSKGSKGPNKSSTFRSNTEGRVSKTARPKAPQPKQQKTKSNTSPVKKKKRVYTDKELGVPKLNMITPVGVDQPKGKKKGRVFVDDQESMMTILAIVNASKEGQIESKMMKSRKMEEIRDARHKEAEARQEQRKSKLEETKDSIRQKRRRKSDAGTTEQPQQGDFKAAIENKYSRKRVSFA